MKKVSIACVMAFVSTFLVMAPVPSAAHASSKHIYASWYGPGFHGRRTASGERFNQYAMTAAHRTLPFGTRVRVSHDDRSIIVVINDRGPFVRGRSLDLSKGAANKLGCSGVCLVEMRVLD